MDFQVNEQTYFVNLGEEPGEWEVFVSTPTGARSIPVYDDAAEFEKLTVVIEDKKTRRIVN